MEFKHASVLFNEVMDGLDPKPGGIYLDGTLGGGGHSNGICSRLGENGLLVGVDRDNDALCAARERLSQWQCRKEFVHARFSEVKRVLQDLHIDSIDGALLDLGVSSFQLDNPDRGFSYMREAPLDMRMDQTASFTAYDVVNDYTKEQLTEVIRNYGEERWASRISEFIVKERRRKPLETTTELVDVIKAAIPASARREGPHPAKRTFQAIRIEVNDELTELRNAIDDYLDVLRPGGRLAIITFHSLEDRIVKEAFKTRYDPCICPPGLPVCVCGRVGDIERPGKPIVPGKKELEENPRSRSAKLRIAIRK